MTFENHVDPEAESAKNDAWFFATYGPPSKPGQTWHEQWASNVGGAERLGTTMVAAASPDPSAFTSAAAAMRTVDLLRRISVASDPGERMALVSEAAQRSVEITVTVVRSQEQTDNVYVKARAGKAVQTGEQKLKRGQQHTFRIALSELLPITDRISVEVRDADWGPDDTLSSLVFTSPFSPQIERRPRDGAEYHTTVRFDR